MDKSSLKNSFSNVSLNYEKYRPIYPRELFEFILQTSKLLPSHFVLDIGCGTGKSCAYFVDNGYHVTCLELSRELLEVARKRFKSFPIEFVQSDFETATFDGKKFSLIVSGQAFHWVDFDVGERKVCDLLKPNGCFAFFWNILDYNSSEQLKKIKALNEQYFSAEVEPHKLAFAVTERLKQSKYFTDVTSRNFAHIMWYSPNSFLELHKTFSWIASLSVDLQKKFSEEFKAIVSDDIQVRYNVLLVMGKKASC